ncbi:VOC family protein [Nocardioides jensenii]|uniref:VOC family protein n=1 Tax=Nocardioides jensenii TaxID=1843 RepID=UPI000833C781|nr:VOC family protein [Nocardioides jensenii]
MEFRFDHVSLSVADLDVSVAFYRDALGFEELPRPGFDFPGAWFSVAGVPVHLTTGGTTRGADAPLRPNDPHFAIAVVGDLDAFLADLADRGVPVHELQDSPAAERQTFVKDPDGNVIEFCVYADAAAQNAG